MQFREHTFSICHWCLQFHDNFCTCLWFSLFLNAAFLILGIPESKEDAERYYGQFMDDFEEEDEQSDDDRRAMVNLVNNLQFVLDDNDQTCKWLF